MPNKDTLINIRIENGVISGWNPYYQRTEYHFPTGRKVYIVKKQAA